MPRNESVTLVIIIFTIGMELRAQVRGSDLPWPPPLFPADNCAFRVTVHRTNGYVYPALPMGARLRLKASNSIASFPEPIRRIFQAMKTYGVIDEHHWDVRQRWNNEILNPAFASLTASDFEVVQHRSAGILPAG